MANPRQRRKSRSSSHMPVSLSRRAKKILKKTPPIRGPKVLQDAWDHGKTVRQNYASLGLIHSLNPTASGGSEKPLVPSQIDTDKDHPITGQDDQHARTDSDHAEPSCIPRGHGRIIRDENGNVVRVEFAKEDAEENEDDQEANMEMLEPQLDEHVTRAWVDGLGESSGSFAQTKTAPGATKDAKGVLEKLERISSWTNKMNGTTISAPLSRAGPRHASKGEREYMKRLVEKYGDDVEKMARDRRLNTEQRTAGQLRRSLKKM